MRAPASPGCFDSDSLLLVCVGVHFLCSPVHDMLSVSQFSSIAPSMYPPIVYLYSKMGCLVICAMARAKLSVLAHSVKPQRGLSAASREKIRRQRWLGILGNMPGCRPGGSGAVPRASITFSPLYVFLPFFFSFALSVSSLLNSYVKPSRLNG